MKDVFRPVSATIAAASLVLAGGQAAAVTINPIEDVMTSAFFFAPDQVRGYAGDNRPTFRVANDNAFGVGPETIYIAFDASDFAALSSPVPQALLSVQSVDGGFGANAGPGNPFNVSAHAVNADPFTEIADDTSTGTTNFLDFFNNNILSAEPESITAVDSFGTIEFDVTDIVNDWIDGNNTFFVIALTGKNDTSGSDFLHGFSNNTENPGATFLTIVPEPSSLALLIGTATFLASRRRRYTA